MQVSSVEDKYCSSLGTSQEYIGDKYCSNLGTSQEYIGDKCCSNLGNQLIKLEIILDAAWGSSQDYIRDNSGDNS